MRAGEALPRAGPGGGLCGKQGGFSATALFVSAGDQSAVAPDCLTVWPHFAVSLRMNSANCSGFSP